eukprot:6196567-Karenia_brevis.AAC.1
MPSLRPSVVTDLDSTLLTMTRPLTKAQQQSLEMSTLQIKTFKFHGYSTFKCRAALTALTHNINTHYD